MPVPEIVTGAVGAYVGLQFNKDFIIAAAVAIILFYLLVVFAERLV